MTPTGNTLQLCQVESLLKITTWKMEATPFDNFFRHKHLALDGLGAIAPAQKNKFEIDKLISNF